MVGSPIGIPVFGAVLVPGPKPPWFRQNNLYGPTHVVSALHFPVDLGDRRNSGDEALELDKALLLSGGGIFSLHPGENSKGATREHVCRRAHSLILPA